MITITKILGSTATKGYLTSFVVHTGAFAVCLAVGRWAPNIIPTLSGYGGRPQAPIMLSIGSAEEVADEIEAPIADVVVSPTHARIGERNFVMTPAADDRAPIVAGPRSHSSPPALLDRDPDRQASNREVQRESHVAQRLAPRRPSRPSSAAMPSVAAVPLPLTPIRFIGRTPRYPAEALSRNWQGTVVLLVHFDAQGWVTRVEIEKSSGLAAADAEAVRTVQTWRAVPQDSGDKLSAQVIRQPVIFNLD